MKVLYIDPTPNPNALKFNVDGKLLDRGWRSFDDKAAAADDPLAWSLFETGQVRSVFVTPTFVTVTVAPEEDWWTIKPRIQAAIEAYDPASAQDEAKNDFGEEDGAHAAGPSGEVDERLARILDLL